MRNERRASHDDGGWVVVLLACLFVVGQLMRATNSDARTLYILDARRAPHTCRNTPTHAQAHTHACTRTHKGALAPADGLGGGARVTASLDGRRRPKAAAVANNTLKGGCAAREPSSQRGVHGSVLHPNIMLQHGRKTAVRKAAAARCNSSQRSGAG